MNIIVRHSAAFKPFKLNFPINWKLDPYKNKNWVHHFNSLRWLTSEKNIEIVENVIKDFHTFHCVKKIKNPYYNERRGDHTAAIRLNVLMRLKIRLDESESSSSHICKELIIKDIENLQSPRLYRSGHNHGIMVDLALLDLLLYDSEYKENINLDLILERSTKTLDAMWHVSGLTREHSVSYQEYNLPLTIEYFKKLKELGVEPSTKTVLPNVIEESKKFLGYSLKENGEYFPLGDSFRIPNNKILNDIYGCNNLTKKNHELLHPYSTQSGIYSNEDFFIARSLINGRKIHLAATCCWNSVNHKKNDELSFSLCIDGITILDTPGWSAFSSEAVNSYISSEFAHSTILISNLNFSCKNELEKGDTGFLPFDFQNKISTARHSRFKGATTFRSFALNNSEIIISDWIETDINLGIVTSRFILSNDVSIKLDDINSVTLLKGELSIRIEVSSEKSGFFLVNQSKIISTNKTEIDDVIALDYVRTGGHRIDFFFKWDNL